MNKKRRVRAITISALIVLSVIIAPVAALTDTHTVAAQENNTTATQTSDENNTTATQSSEECVPGGNDPALTQSRLYAPEKVLEGGEPGQVAGGFQTDATANCPVQVSITMQVPSGMRISGSSDIMSGGAGIVSAEFTVDPGEVRSIRASVFSEDTGSRTVTADIQYWPVGHQDMAKQIDGISMTFDVREPVTEDSDDNSGSGIGGIDSTTALVGAILLLLLVSIVGLVARN
ncbi:hypothetical protein [Halorubrum ezzemoulense]|uniref:hypothetical protein n=1 Tax=Halorubrum ezzemoulense TaxID=337243 RepID=UPI001179A126|nr:hypothetical protein [Halorubrum ezzemoulense]